MALGQFILSIGRDGFLPFGGSVARGESGLLGGGRVVGVSGGGVPYVYLYRTTFFSAINGVF